MLGSSECSSGCESGWTLYLDHSVSSPNTSNFREINGCEYKKSKDRKTSKHVEDDEEEDLSMVSDASSGPPVFNEDEACDFGYNYKPPCFVPRQTGVHSNSSVRQRKQSKRESKERKKASFLDDTASSPFIDFNNSNLGVENINHGSLESALDYSQGFSATPFQGRPAFQDQYGFFQSSFSGNQFQNNQWF